MTTSAAVSIPPSTGGVGIAIVGLGGAVATTAVAGVELMKMGLAGTEGLPLVEAGELVPEGLVGYQDLVFGGWDLSGDSLYKAAEVHGVLDHRQLEAAAPALEPLTPWPAVGNASFLKRVSGANVVVPRQADGESMLRAQVRTVVADLERFRATGGPGGCALDAVVVLNLASTESWPDLASPELATAAGLEAALDADSPQIPPALVYAYAAVTAGCPYGNFTPSAAADVPALAELALARGVPVAGKDGKTGQTMIKTVLAPAFRSRALRVEGWYSTNILGNRDGQALDDPASLASKIGTKGGVLDSVLGYPVEDHVVRIDYYRPRGDAKEAWDNIDLVGFLGQKMQLKIDFLCRDSVLAAPLALEIARLLDLAQRRGQGGVAEELGFFFKQPQTREPGGVPEHALPAQERALLAWMRNGRATAA